MKYKRYFEEQVVMLLGQRSLILPFKNCVQTYPMNFEHYFSCKLKKKKKFRYQNTY